VTHVFHSSEVAFAGFTFFASLQKESAMTRFALHWALTGVILSLLGCAPAVTGWRHFHGDLRGQGFLNVKSGYAVSPSWRSEPLKITGSSPVLGRDAAGAEVIYVGTTDATLVAVDAATGAARWKRSLGSPGVASSIVSSPTVADDGGILVVSTADLGGGRLQSWLHKVDRQGQHRWSQLFPNGGFTTGAPRAFTFAGQSLVLVRMLAGNPGALRSEVLVMRDAGEWGELAGRQALAECRGSGLLYSGLLRTWSLLAAFPLEPGVGPVDLILDPTPALNTDRSNPLIVAADNLCRIAVLEWDGAKLSVLWEAAHSGQIHSSPAVLSPNLVVLGRRDGTLLAYDGPTGVKMWQYDAGEPIYSTPSGSATGIIFAASAGHLHAVQAGSGESALPSGTGQRLAISGSTLSSPAVTAECVYLPMREMLTVSHDFKVRSYNSAFSGNGLSSPAVGSDGSIYVVALDGAIWKYQGPK
jgi:outer membrane protein assembly factor BamB